MLNAPEVPEPPRDTEIQQPTDPLASLRGDLLELSARLARLEHKPPLVPQLDCRLAHLEREVRRLDGKLDDLWREHTRLVNRLE
jgi:ubiquinone biosynthesis protein UbiJ